MGLVLDTNIFVDGERQRHSPAMILSRVRQVFGESEFAISVITILELDHGIFRTSSPAKSELRRLFSADLCNVTAVHSVTLEIARLAGRVEGEQAARGFAIPLADLLIGATALHLNFSVLTLNPKHFHLIPNLTVVTL